MEGAQQFFLIDLNYVDHFDYKVNFITKLDVFKSYINTAYIDEISLQFAICYDNTRKIICQLLFFIFEVEVTQVDV